MFNGFAGSNPVKFMRAYADLGLKARIPLLAGWTAMDDALLKSLGDEAVGVHSAAFYSASFGSESNKRFVAAMAKDYNVLPGGYSAGMYVAGQCVEAAIQALGGKADDRKAFADALHKVVLTDTPRGPIKFDQYGNVIGDVFIRKCEKTGRPARQYGGQDLSQRQPVLDLRGEGVPGGASLWPRLSAGEEPGELRRRRLHPSSRKSRQRLSGTQPETAAFAAGSRIASASASASGMTGDDTGVRPNT